MDYKLTELLTYFGQEKPYIWKMVEALRLARGKHFPIWPHWCFLPMTVLIQEMCAQKGEKVSLKEAAECFTLSGMASWRVTQGIYQFDPDIFEEVWETPINGDIPAQVLYHLPEWCLYIPTPGKTIHRFELLGFFAFMDWNHHTNEEQITFILHFWHPDTGTRKIHPVNILLNCALKESLTTANCLLPTGEEATAWTQALHKLLEHLLSLLLFLASQAEHIQDPKSAKKPTYAKPTRTKKGERYFPPNQPTHWEVGYRLGAALRNARLQETSQQSITESLKYSSRPHIRRAHWHTYWTGPKNAEQSPVLKWLPPIPVNLDLGEIVPTIRPVE